MNQSTTPTDVASLICSRDLAMSSRCLGSLVKYSADPLRLIFHDDGSLSASERDALQERIPASRVISRTEADERISSLLGVYPNCTAFRRENVFGLKLFDAMLLSDGPKLNYCDGDVLFFRPFTGLFALCEDAGAAYMKDSADNCCLRSWEMARYGVRFVSRANAGLLCFRRSLFDLDRLEWFFGLPRRPLFKHFIEQSAWAYIGAQVRTVHWDPSQVRLMVPMRGAMDELVAGHYVATYRADLATANEHACKDIAPVAIRFQAAGVCRARDLFAYEVRRHLHRRFPKLGVIHADPYARLR